MSPGPSPGAPDPLLLQRIETFYDAVPRQGARVEVVSRLTLFVREGDGWPYYARPAHPLPGAIRADEITAADVRAVRARQVELGVPQELEWLHDLNPEVAGAASEAGLAVRLCPLLALDGALTGVPEVAGTRIDLARPADTDLAAVEAVAEVGFGAGIGTRVGPAGVAERDAAAARVEADRLAGFRAALTAGTAVRAVARTDVGPVGVGGYQRAAGVAEIVGVATLPSHRRRGVGAALAARLALAALDAGCGTVFLSAQDEEVARVYHRVGFRRVGTAGLAGPPE